MNSRYKAAFALAFLLLVYTLYTILLQIGGSTIGLIPQLFYAFLVGFVVSSVVSFVMDRGKGFASIVGSPKMFLTMIAIGLINNALSQLSLGIGTLGTNPSIGGIVYRSWVIMALILTPLVLKQKVKKIQIFATLIGFLGLYLVLSGGTLFGFNFAQAPFMGFLLFAALSSVMVTLIMSKYTFNVFGAAVIFNFASFLLLAFLAVATHTSLAVNLPLSSAFSVLFLGIFGFGVGTTLYYYTIKVFGPQVVGNAILIVPFLTILFSFFLVGTPIRAYYVVAALLISAGVILQRHYSMLPERITKSRILDRFTIFDVTGAFISNKSPEISSSIAGGNRAFAIRLDGRGLDEMAHAGVFGRYGCLSFTTQKPHAKVTAEEIRTVADAMKLEGSDTALIGLGNPDRLEDAFAEFLSTSQPRVPR
jgi:drug/metabolite transporter (DMT)-like permease